MRLFFFIFECFILMMYMVSWRYKRIQLKCFLMVSIILLLILKVILWFFDLESNVIFFPPAMLFFFKFIVLKLIGLLILNTQCRKKLLLISNSTFVLFESQTFARETAENDLEFELKV